MAPKSSAFDFDAWLAAARPGVRAPRRSGDERILPCPWCGREEKCYVNARKGVFVCFRCGERGTLRRFVGAVLGVDREQAGRIVGAGAASPAVMPVYDRAALRTLLAVPARASARTTVQGDAVDALPEGYRPLPDPSSVIAAEAWRYLLDERGLTPSQVMIHRIGVATRGFYGGCVIVPIVMDGAIVHWVARAFMRPGPKRYLNPPNGRTPMTSGEVIFNHDTAFLTGRVTVCEGVFDALAEGDGAVALLGKAIRPAQVERFAAAAASLERVTVKLDEDAYPDALRVARAIADAGVRCVDVVQPYGDPGERRGVRRRARYGLSSYVAGLTGSA